MLISNGSQVTVKTPLSLTTSSLFARPFPPMATRSWPSAYSTIYRSQLWVYVVVNKLAAGAARLPLVVYERDDLDRPRDDDHPMAELLRQPNPSLSSFEFWFWVSATRDVFGEAPVYKRRQGGKITGLYPLHPTGLQENEDGSWRFDNGTLVLERIAPTDLMLFKHYDPQSMDRGMSPLEPLRLTLENEWHARNATSSFWQRGARPGMALQHPGQLSEEAGTRLRQQFDDVAAGSGNTGRTVILEEGMVPHPLMVSNEEAQYIETRKLNREETCAVYDVPPPAVHILDHATFSNITEQMRSVYRDTQAPRLKYFESVIERELRAVEWPNDDVYAEFLMDEVLRGDFEARQAALDSAKHMTIAEKRKIENLPFIEGSDRIFLNLADVPMTAPTSSDAPPPPPFQQVGLPALIAAGVITRDEARTLVGVPGTAPGVPEPAPVAAPDLPTEAVRSVMGRLSWQKSLDQINPDSLIDGLTPWDALAVLGAVAAEEAAAGTVKGLRERIRGLVARPGRKAAPDVDENAKAVASTLRAFFARQAAAVGDSTTLDTDAWDAELTDDLHAVAVVVSSKIGKTAVRTLGFDAEMYDVDRTVDFLRAVAERYAVNINASTAAALAVDGAEPAAVFEAASGARSDGIATAVTANVAGFAVVEAGKRVAESQGGAPKKTWVTGPNPRESHAAMNGETVEIDKEFSNGMMWPGSGGDEGDVGCNCMVDISYEGGS